MREFWWVERTKEEQFFCSITKFLRNFAAYIDINKTGADYVKVLNFHMYKYLCLHLYGYNFAWRKSCKVYMKRYTPIYIFIYINITINYRSLETQIYGYRYR